MRLEGSLEMVSRLNVFGISGAAALPKPSWVAFNEACAGALTSVRLSTFWWFWKGNFAVAATAELASIKGFSAATGGLVDVVSNFTVATLGIVVRFSATKTSGL